MYVLPNGHVIIEVNAVGLLTVIFRDAQNVPTVNSWQRLTKPWKMAGIVGGGADIGTALTYAERGLVGTTIPQTCAVKGRFQIRTVKRIRRIVKMQMANTSPELDVGIGSSGSEEI